MESCASRQPGETTRRVDGDRCDQVVDALALTTVIASRPGGKLFRSFDGASARRARTRAAGSGTRAARRDPTPVSAGPAFSVQARRADRGCGVVSPYVSVGGEVFARLAKGTEDSAVPDVGSCVAPRAQ